MLSLTTALVDKSLVVVEPQVLGQARYRMLDTIREYAAARLADGGDSERIRLALRDDILRVAEESLTVGMAQVPVPWPERVACSLRYDADSANVAQVLAWCLDRGDARQACGSASADQSALVVWGTFAEGGEWLDSFLALQMPGLSPRVRGAALVARAQLALSSDPAAAGALAGAGLELCREAGDHLARGCAGRARRGRLACGADR